MIDMLNTPIILKITNICTTKFLSRLAQRIKMSKNFRLMSHRKKKA